MSDKCPTHVRRNPACPICARVSRAERESELAALNGSPCVVCGSPLTLGIERTVPVLMVHCNTCGSEVPWHVTQKLNLYKARGKTAASMENAERSDGSEPFAAAPGSAAGRKQTLDNAS